MRIKLASKEPWVTGIVRRVPWIAGISFLFSLTLYLDSTIWDVTHPEIFSDINIAFKEILGNIGMAIIVFWFGYNFVLSIHSRNPDKIYDIIYNKLISKNRLGYHILFGPTITREYDKYDRKYLIIDPGLDLVLIGLAPYVIIIPGRSGQLYREMKENNGSLEFHDDTGYIVYPDKRIKLTKNQSMDLKVLQIIDKQFGYRYLKYKI